MKYREIIKIIEKDGWIFSRQRGSHKHYKHKIKSGTVTVASKANDDIAIGTLKSILKQAQINLK